MTKGKEEKGYEHARPVQHLGPGGEEKVTFDPPKETLYPRNHSTKEKNVREVVYEPLQGKEDRKCSRNKRTHF